MTVKDRKRQQESIAYWRTSAERDWAAAQAMFASKHYDWSIFVAHLALEKLLKALVVQEAEMAPPRTHDLFLLANSARLSLPEELSEWLPTITKFNLEARYDEVKSAFYEKATHDFSTLWLQRCHEVYQWLLDQPN